jgi:hypothetical protein
MSVIFETNFSKFPCYKISGENLLYNGVITIYKFESPTKRKVYKNIYVWDFLNKNIYKKVNFNDPKEIMGLRKNLENLSVDINFVSTLKNFTKEQWLSPYGIKNLNLQEESLTEC